MGLHTPKEYISTIDSFAAHWVQVDAKLGSPLVLTGNYWVADLASDRVTLMSEMAAVEAARNVHQGAMGTRSELETEMRERMRQFIALARAAFPGTRYLGLLPALPKAGSGGPVWLSALTSFGLAAPGDTAHFKVFLVVRSRRPKGSNAVAVTRA